MKHLGLLLPLLLLASACAPPPVTYDSQWARTGTGTDEGCSYMITTATDAVGFQDLVATGLKRWSLPAQLLITNNATTSVDFCFSQDPTPIIASAGVFTADPTGYYARGSGKCATYAAGSMLYFGAVTGDFSPIGGTGRVGGRPGRCETTGAPCVGTGECGGAACSRATLPGDVYLFAVPHTSGSSRLEVCAHD